MTLSTPLNEILVYSFGGKILAGFGDEYIEVDICPINYSAVSLVFCVVIISQVICCQWGQIVFEEAYAARDSTTLEQLKELSSKRRMIEESINESSSITTALAREMSGGLTSRSQQVICQYGIWYWETHLLFLARHMRFILHLSFSCILMSPFEYT